jgi:molybdopterin-guanine dinucleotide biosynthesis protein A
MDYPTGDESEVPLANPQITGLLLAGGAGRRVGGADKGLLEWRGAPLAVHVSRWLRPQVSRLVVSCNRNRAFYAKLADDTVADCRGHYQGPLAGIEAAEPLLQTRFAIIVPCDTPLLPGHLVPRLLAPLLAGAGDIAYASDGERDHYLCAALRCSILPSLGPFLDGGQRAVRAWYAQHRSLAVEFPGEAHCFTNYNEMTGA